MLSNESFIYFNSSLTGRKSLLGIFLSLLFYALSILIFVKGFQSFNKSDPIRTQNSGSPDDYEPMNNTLTIAFPKTFLEYGRWIDVEGRVRQPATFISEQECTESEFKRFYPNSMKNSKLIYYCHKVSKVPDIRYYWVQFDLCNTINNHIAYERARDPTCKANATSKIIDEMSHLISTQIHYMEFNETDKTLFYKNFTLDPPKPEKDAKRNNYFVLKIFSFRHELDEEIFYNKVSIINSTQTPFNYTYYDGDLIYGFDMDFYVNSEKFDFHIVSFYKSKINIILGFLVSIVTILYWILYFLNSFYSEYNYKLGIFELLIQNQGIENIKLTLNIQIKNPSLFDKNLFDIFNFKQYTLSYFRKNEEFDILERFIIDSISLEKILNNKITESKQKIQIEDIKEESILEKLDCLSNVGFIHYNNSTSFKSSFHWILFVFLKLFFVFILIAIGTNYFDTKNTSSNYSVEPFNNYKYDPQTNVAYEKLSRLKLKRTVYETFKLVKFDYSYSTKSNYLILKHHECSIKELKDIFNIEENDDNYINICITNKDLLSDIFTNPVFDHEIHLVKCSDNLDLFSENDCKNLVSPNEKIDIEIEIEILDNKRKMKKGSVRYADEIFKKGYFVNQLVLKSNINSFINKKQTYFNVDGLSFRYSQTLNNRNKSVFSWYLKIMKHHHLTESGNKNILTFFTIIISYYQIIKQLINFLLSLPFEYFYLKNAISKIYKQRDKDNNNDNSKIHINNIISEEAKVNVNQDEVIDVSLKKINDIKIEGQEKSAINNFSSNFTNNNLTFCNFLKFKLNILDTKDKEEFALLMSSLEVTYLTKIQKNKDILDEQQGLIYSLDIFSEQKNYFYFNRKNTVKTKVGGFFTIIILLAVIPIIYFVNEDYWKHINPIKRTSLMTQTSPAFERMFNSTIYPIISYFNFTLEMDEKMKDEFYFSDNWIFKSSNYTGHTGIVKKDDNRYFSTISLNVSEIIIVQHKCFNQQKNIENFRCSKDKIYDYNFTLSYFNADENKLQDGYKLIEEKQNFATNAYDLPYYHKFFNKYIVLDNTNNILDFDPYKEHYLNLPLTEGIRKNKQWSKNGLEALEVYIYPSFDYELRINHYKTISNVVIDSFSFISITILILETISSHYSYFKFLEIWQQKNKMNKTISFTFQNYILDHVYLAPKEFKAQLNEVLKIVSLENFE